MKYQLKMRGVARHYDNYMLHINCSYVEKRLIAHENAFTLQVSIEDDVFWDQSYEGPIPAAR